MKRIVFTQLLIFFGYFSLFAQTTKGTDFWFGYMKNSHAYADLEVYICADIAASGDISMPAIGWNQSFNVASNSTTMISIPYAQALPLNTGIEDMGIHLVSDVDVQVYAMNYLQMTSDASIVLPTSGLGNEYYTSSYDPATSVGQKASEFIVVATDDNTLINITPNDDIIGGAMAGNTFSITLNKGQLYQAQSYGDLNGSRVWVDASMQGLKPIAVYSGNEGVNVGGCPYQDHLFEAMLPIPTWGKEYIGVPFKNKLGDEFIIIASKDGTVIDIGGTVQNLNKGESYTYFSDTTHYICSNKDISLSQYCRGYNCDNMDGDPLMIVHNALGQRLNEINFNAFTSSVITNYYVNVVCPSSGNNTLLLDGVDITSQLTPLASNPSFSFAQLDISSGNHQISASMGLLASVYGFGGKESYGYSAGYNLDEVQDSFEVLDIISSDICVGSAVNLNEILVSDALNIKWDFGNGEISMDNAPQTIYQSTGTYDIQLIIERLCSSDTVSQQFDVVECDANPPWIPNAFSPNMDGVNDQLYVRGINNGTFRITVYDRFGRMVYESINDTDSWDGTYKGKDLEMGVYVYYLSGELLGEPFSFKGNISLVR